MSRKSRERRKARAEGKDQPEAKSPATLAALKRRRNRRFLFVGLIALSFPILEVIAYRFRTITVTLINRAQVPIDKLKVNYGNGEFEADQIKPNGVFTRVIRPDFTFKGDYFSTYPFTIRYSVREGMQSHINRAGALDFSATEVYTFVSQPPDGQIQVQHSTRPGFPLSLVRDLMERLGFR